MAAYAEAASIGTILSTNGHFFHSVEYCREVVASGMKKLIICVDGLDQKTIEGLRGEVSFEKITNGLRYMVQAKREMKSATPEIQLQFILMKYNQHQKEQARQFAIDAGVDEFCIKPVGVGMKDPDFERLALELLPDDLSESHYQRDAAGKITLRGDAPGHCWWLTTVPVIYADGSVVPCCYDIDSEHVMGNVFEQPLADIWRGEKFCRFRREVRKSRQTISPCRFCFEGRVLGRKEEKLTQHQA
jgi:radical SAM protein with 4Fe4S-binding SPASM domain